MRTVAETHGLPVMGTVLMQVGKSDTIPIPAGLPIPVVNPRGSMGTVDRTGEGADNRAASMTVTGAWSMGPVRVRTTGAEQRWE